MSAPPLLITGAAGWLGRRLVAALRGEVPEAPAWSSAAPPALRCLLERREDAAALPEDRTLDLRHGDLRQPAALRAFCEKAGGAVLFHLAAVIHPRRSSREFEHVNVRGTAALLEAAEDAGVRRVVVMSSTSPVGTNPDPTHRFDETAPYRPYVGYGRSKMKVEQLAAAAAARGRLETVVVRAPWFYGPMQPARQSEWFRMIQRGDAPIVGGGDNVRSMAYLDNLCQGLILAAQHPAAAGQTYWVADRRPYSMNEIVDTVERLLRDEFDIPVTGRRLRLPGLAAKLAYATDWTLQRLGLYHQKIHVLSEMNKNIACRIDKAERELGYAPTVDLEEGMRRSLRWCVEHGVPLR
ncbi:MAG: NAD(P)-dependent oxidoreductase [Planctomycetota bacterium]